MASVRLPVNSDAPHYRFSSTLEGRLYTFEFRWNDRSGAWFMSIYDANGAAIVSGRRVMLGANLLGRSADPRLPRGALIAYDTSGKNVDAGRDDFGSRVEVVFSPT